MMRCPICAKPVAEPAGDLSKTPFPFCCERCKLIDLGRWLDGKYQIPVEEPDGATDDPRDARDRLD